MSCLVSPPNDVFEIMFSWVVACLDLMFAHTHTHLSFSMLSQSLKEVGKGGVFAAFDKLKNVNPAELTQLVRKSRKREKEGVHKLHLFCVSSVSLSLSIYL